MLVPCGRSIRNTIQSVPFPTFKMKFSENAHISNITTDPTIQTEVLFPTFFLCKLLKEVSLRLHFHDNLIIHVVLL